MNLRNAKLWLAAGLPALLLPVTACQSAPANVAPARPQTLAPPAAVDESVLVLGHSVQGQPIHLHVFGLPQNPTLIFAGIHGDEPTSVAVAIDLLFYLRAHPEVYRAHPVAILPIANPDGLDQRSRQNINGVDCNRNFPATNWADHGRERYWGGAEPASEPETRAVMLAVNLLRPRQIISIHSISGERQCNNYDGPARYLADVLSAHNGYPPKGYIGYPTPGSFGSWAGIDQGYPVVTLELPGSAPAARAWSDNRAALLAAIRTVPPEYASRGPGE